MNPGIQEEMKTKEFWERVSPGFQFVFKISDSVNLVEIDKLETHDGYVDVWAHPVTGETWNSFLGMLNCLCWNAKELSQYAKKGMVMPLEGRQPLTAVSVSTGCICKRCNSKNDFAAPNQKDGSYVCFECRV